MKKKIWMTAGLVLCSILTLFACIYLYDMLSEPSIPTGTVITGTTIGSATQDTTLVTTTVTEAPTASNSTVAKPTITPSGDFAWTKAQEDLIASMMQEYGGTVSLWYEDLTSGYVYQYNADTVFSAASVIKAPYCMYIFQLASEGKCDLGEMVTYTENIKSDGTGIIKNAEYGTAFAVQQLLECAIRYSDNAALRMLRSLYPAEGFREYAASIGIKNADIIANITSAKITAEDAATYMRAIYNFIETNEVYGQLLRQYMTTTRNPMFTSSSYDIIRKYGWAPEAFHDTAIIDAPRPYILVFLTDHAEGTQEDFAMFRTLSRTVESFSGQPAE